MNARRVFLSALSLMCVSLLSVSLPPAFGEEVFAPFISGLDTRVEDNSVVLSWKDSDSSIDSYIVYRSSEAVTRSNFSSASELARVEAGQESYIDTPPTTDPYYYAVIAADKDGEKYELFIPYRNVTVNPVSVADTSTVEEKATDISSIHAEVRGKTVHIEFERSKPERDLIVYRSTSPLRKIEDLVNAAALSSSSIDTETHSITDQPLPGISYYYGIFDSQLAEAGEFTFSPGENVTESSVEIPLDKSSLSRLDGETKRFTPLPFLFLSESVFTGKDIPGTVPLFSSSGFAFTDSPESLSRDTQKAVEALTRDIRLEKEQLPQKLILPSDRDLSSLSGTHYRLAKIVHQAFSEDNWETLAEDLESFLLVNHAENITARARFYLGQAYLYTERYRKAFLEFTMARGSYRKEVHGRLSYLYSVLDS
ncbi:MAG: hypothetical protein ACLFMZ_09640 [Spirochaetaceae bacterium]